MGSELRRLHEWYLSRARRQANILVPFTPAQFPHANHGTVSVAFQDLWDLYNWKWLDVSLLRTSVLCMMKLASTLSGVSVGFFDPERITQDFLSRATDQAEAYMTAALLDQQDKEYILAPYIQGVHWVLLVICPRKNQVHVLDSNKKGDKSLLYVISWTFNQAFKNYTSKGGRHMKSRENELKWELFQCRQQPDKWECGYYVMRFMYELIMTYLTDFPRNMMSASRYKAQELVEIRRFVVKFMLDEVLNKVQFKTIDL